MKLNSKIKVRQSLEEVNLFFDEPGNLAKWDRSVAKVIVTTTGSIKEGFTFDTISPSGLKMSYRVKEYERGKQSKVLLTHSKMFRYAMWQMTFCSIDNETEIGMNIDLIPKGAYYFLIPILFFNRKALFTDLTYLQKALDECFNKQKV